jgi:death-on-curing protein
LADALSAHERALRFGGLPGIRDLGLIESAVSRPFTGYYRSIESKAAALVQSMSGNHGFIDGNKRTTVILADTLLARSGYRLERIEVDPSVGTTGAGFLVGSSTVLFS